MLNDYFITRDAPGFVLRFIRKKGLKLPELENRLLAYSGKQHLSYEQWWQLLEELDGAVKKPALGVIVGQSIEVAHCGVLGYLFRTSQNVLDALSCYRRYERLLYAGSAAEAYIEHQEMTLIWPTDQGLSSQISDALLLSALVNIIREILNLDHISPLRVSFTHPVPESDMATYQDFFKGRITSGAPRLEITFALQDLLRPIPFHDETLHRILDQQAEELIRHLPEQDDFLTALRNTIAQNLHNGACEAAQAAQAMNISTRTLHRRLQQRGTLFRTILQDVRKTMARHYLADPTLSIAEITLLLGYSEQSAFNRAHQAWYGNTPLRHRHSLTEQV